MSYSTIYKTSHTLWEQILQTCETSNEDKNEVWNVGVHGINKISTKQFGGEAIGKHHCEETQVEK